MDEAKSGILTGICRLLRPRMEKMLFRMPGNIGAMRYSAGDEELFDHFRDRVVGNLEDPEARVAG